jgi:hypothetical protein
MLSHPDCLDIEAKLADIPFAPGQRGDRVIVGRPDELFSCSDVLCASSRDQISVPSKVRPQTSRSKGLGIRNGLSRKPEGE